MLTCTATSEKEVNLLDVFDFGLNEQKCIFLLLLLLFGPRAKKRFVSINREGIGSLPGASNSISISLSPSGIP